MELVIGRKPSNKFTERLAQLTEEAKKNTQWKKQYMDWERQRTYDYEDGKEAGINIGLAEGAQQKAVEDAKKLLADGKYTAEEISVLLKLPVEAFTEQITS